MEDTPELWDEVIDSFRKWNREWQAFEHNARRRNYGIMPKNLTEFMHDLSNKYNISKK